MIELISFMRRKKRDFLKSLDEKSTNPLLGYAFRGISDELILGFRTEDDNSAPQSSRNECVLITEDAKLISIYQELAQQILAMNC